MTAVPPTQIRPQQALPPTFAELLRVFAAIGVLSFGGPVAQIGLMHRIAVDEKRWLSEERFLHALNYCMLLPGPEAQQLATYIGWLLHGVRGGVAAGLLFVLPGFCIILGLSVAYVSFQETTWLAGLFFGLKAAVLAIVVEAVIRIGRRALKTGFHRLVAALAFLSLFLLSLPFPLVVLFAGLAGFLFARSAGPAGQGGDVSTPMPARVKMPALGRSLARLAFWILVWQAPLALLWLFGQSGLATLFTFFSKMALVTFGGAYAVLAYVAQVAVEHYQWLRPGEMLDGLALAETTPGPLVLVLSFVGFLAALRQESGLDPLAAGLLGALLTAWATFVPSFVWIFAGAPYIERLRGNRALNGALSAITAAVVGVILNLAVWFALHVLFARVNYFVLWRPGPPLPDAAAPGFPSLSLVFPDPASLDAAALGVAVLAALLVFYLRLATGWTLILCAAAGLLLRAAV
ncbi:MAG: chromate efflux transporter [Allorhizobium sp.]